MSPNPTLAVVLLLGLAPAPAPAQEPADEIRQDALRVFLDCNAFQCDSDYSRTGIGFVNWVRDRTAFRIRGDTIGGVRSGNGRAGERTGRGGSIFNNVVNNRFD